MSSTPPQFNPSESPNYGFTIPHSPSRNLRALLNFLDTVEAADADAMMACCDEALEHRILPMSLGRPVLNKRQYGEYMKAIMKLFDHIRITIHEVIETDNDKLTVHASSTGESIIGTPYSNEVVLIIHLVPAPPDSGPNALPKFRFVKEFVDSSNVQKFHIEQKIKAKQKAEAAKKSSFTR